MSLRFSISFISFLPAFLTLECHCTSGGTDFCTGDYCYSKEVEGYKLQTGCITPRQDAWEGEKLPLCEKNLYNSTLCLCNHENYCNTVETFAKIKEEEAYVEQKLIDCVNLRSYPTVLPPTCQSSFCSSSETRGYNEFMDLDRPPYSDVNRECPDGDIFYAFRIDIGPDSPPMNSCIHIRYDSARSSIFCRCNTTNCNEKTPMYNLTKRGKRKCYLKTETTETTTCWGDYCYWGDNYGRGCIDVAGDANFKFRLGESTLDNTFLSICDGDFCNGDVKYPNGTIVGPSADRRYASTNIANSLALTSLFLLSLTKLLL